MSRIDNANYGVHRVGGPGTQGIFEESSTPKHPIGEKVELADGRAATGAGLLVSQDISATAIVESDGKLTAASAGATEVTYTDSGTVGSATLNQYAGGYLHITDDAGEGYNYRIKSNTAASSNAITFTLFDSLQVAVTTATDVAVTGNLYNQVRAALGTADYIVCGVTPIAFTSGYYGWVQTRGIAVILTDDSDVGAGVPVMCGDAQAGAVEVADNSHPLVGFVTHAADDTGYMGVALQLP